MCCEDHTVTGPEALRPIREEDNIPVVISSSNYYAPYVGVYIQSLIDHASPAYSYDIIIMEREISEENKRLLLSLKRDQENVSIRFYNPGTLSPLLAQVKADARYPLEVYWRIFIPYLFTRYRKIIVTAADMLLKEDIAQLFAIDLGEACAGAALDMGAEAAYRGNLAFRSSVSKITGPDYLEHVLGMKNPLHYINPDAALYNPSKFVSECDLHTVASFLNEKAQDCLYLDQDVLSVLMEGKLLFLPLKWNFGIPLNHDQRQYLSLVSQETREAYLLAGKSPALLHWAGRPKPWVCPDVPYGNEWWETAMRTPFLGHILARMFDALQMRREYYKNRYGQEVAVWDPAPVVDRSWKGK